MSLLSSFTIQEDVSGPTAEGWFPAMTALPRGRAAAAWTEDGNAGIILRLFDAAGLSEGPGVRITDPGESANRPALTVLENGNLVVAYTELVTISSAVITARIFDETGRPISAPKQIFVPSTGTSVSPEVIALKDGGFVMVHENYGLDGSLFGVFGQVLEADGSPRGSFFRVNQTTESFQSGARIAALDDGGFAVTWNSRNIDGSSDAVMVRTYDADGAPRTSEIRVNQFSNNRQTDPDITKLSDGRLLITWESEGQDGSGRGVYARFVSDTGLPSGPEFRVNTRTTDDQVNPSVSATPDGGFIVAWDNENSQDSTDVRYQLFDGAGNKVGPESIVGAGLPYLNAAPEVDVGADGVARLAWLNLERGAEEFSVFVAFSGRAIEGDDGGNLLIGTTANDVIRGLDGDDISVGLAGNDSIYGGEGNDSIQGGSGFDSLNGDAGDDTIDGQSNADSIVGGSGNDVLIGGAGTDRLEGGKDDDVLFGGDGADRLFGEDGNDLIRAGSNFGSSVDGVEGGAGNDTIFGEGGFDLLIGGDGNDRIDGGNQADELRGDAGQDTLIGGNGFDRLFGGSGDDLLQDFDGFGGLFGGSGNDTIQNADAPVNIFAGQGNDLIDAGGGDDNVTGNAGFDTIIGGAGDDTLRGAFNADTFVFADGHGVDTVLDFDAQNDLEKIDLSAASFVSALADLELESTTSGAAVQDGADVLIVTGAGSEIRLIDVSLADLDGNDFIF